MPPKKETAKKNSSKLKETVPSAAKPQETPEPIPAVDTPVLAAPIIKMETPAEVTPLESALCTDGGSMSNYLMLPSEIERLWKSPRVKDELVLYFQEKWKPKSQYDPEKIEYNQIIIVAEFVMYNIIFARNEMMFDQFKTAMLNNLLWRLLEYDPTSDPKDIQSKILSSDNRNESSMNANNIEFKGDDMMVDREFQEKLTSKVSVLKNLITQQLVQENPALRINRQEAVRIVNYAHETYFRHLRLYEMVFNNKTASEIKRVNFEEDQARKAAPLKESL